MIMTMTTIVTVIGTTMDKMIVEMMVMATDEVEAGMVDTISIDDERCRKLVRNIQIQLATALVSGYLARYVGTMIVSDLNGNNCTAVRYSI